MRHIIIFTIAVFVIFSFNIPNDLSAQDTQTFAFKLNGHKYNQQEDLMIRAIEEWFLIAMDSLDLPTLIDTLAAANGLDSIKLNIPEAVDVFYEVDESETYDFLSNITMDTLNILAWGLGCEFEVDITGAGFVIGGTSNYENGEFKIDLGEPDTLKPEISVVGTGHILCPVLADTFKSAIGSEIDSLLLGLASMYESESFDNLLTFLNPIQALGIEDSVLIEQALQSFPMNMDMYTEKDDDQEIVQLIIEINFLLGTTDNPTAFIDIKPEDITGSQLQTGGFSFLYWVLQESFPWHDWTESQNVDAAFDIMDDVGLDGYRLELRWSDLQNLAYLGDERDPVDITPEMIDSVLTESEHWDTTAFLAIQEYLNNGFTRKLVPFMAVGVGHEDRMPLDASDLRIAPATEEWEAAEGYIGVSASEYLYNLKIYAHATVRKFADEIEVWQIENELNAAGFAAAVPEWWRKGDLWLEADFRNQVWAVLVDAVRTEDPTAMIIHDLHMLGFMQALEEWVEDMDIVGINYYPNQVASLPVMGFTVGEYVWAVRRALNGLGHEDKPVWLTETGYPGIVIANSPDSINLADDVVYFSENRQNEYVETALRLAVDNGVSGFFYYSLVTQEDRPGGITIPMRFSGMVRRDTDAYKPALQTFADLYEQLLVIDPTAINDEILILPEKASLHQNYPNPFNPTTVISYQLPVSSSVKLHLFNVRGQLVETIYSGRQEAGNHKIEWNAGHLASGVYFYRLKAGNFTDIKKMILLK